MLKSCGEALRLVVRSGLSCAVVAAILISAPLAASAFEPTSQYSRMQINGWTVYVSSGFSANPKGRDAIVRKITNQLAFVAGVMTPKQLKILRKADIWVETGDHWRALARYVNKGNIYQEDLNIKKNQDIEIFGNFAKLRQPTLLLHELAHVYHDRKLEWQDKRIENLYDAFKVASASAKDRCGKPREAYGLTSHNEFFATFTEAYFAETCTYPYNRATIGKRHPEMLALLVKVWGAR